MAKGFSFTIKRDMVLGAILLLIASIIWGSAFVAQSTAMDHIGPFTMNGLRSLLAFLFLLPVALVADKIKGKKPTLLGTNDKGERKTLLIGGLMLGLLVTVASTIQQIGIIYTTVGKAGFLTTLYIVIVPILGLFLKKRVKFNVWIAVVLSLIGMYLLCLKESFSIGMGDALIIISAFFFAIHILLIEKYSPISDGIRLSCIQFFVCAVVCLTAALIFENPEWESIKSAAVSIAYAGILSAGVGYTLQIIGQKTVPSHIAPLIMSLESVFSVLAGVIILKETMQWREIVGCVIIFIAITLTQITFGEKKHADNEQIVFTSQDDCQTLD